MSTASISRALRPIGLHEMVLQVRDLDASVQFYEDIIGLKIIARWEDDRKAVWLDMGDTAALGLWPPETGGSKAIANARGGSHVHFALRIPHGSIDVVRARLDGLGYPTERVKFEDGNRSLYVDDPDGNCVELMDAVVDWSGDPVAADARRVDA